MTRIAALAFVFGLVVSGCHGSESCRLRHEVEELRRENEQLRVEVTRLIKENQALAASAAKDDEGDDDEDDDAMDVWTTTKPRDLMDPFPSAAPSNADKLLEQAQDAYVHGYYKKAIELAGRVRDYQPRKAFRIMGAASCFLKDERGAKRAYQALEPQGQQFLKYVCMRNEIEL
jgi:hypothetical protein